MIEITHEHINIIKSSWRLLQRMEPLMVGDIFYGKLFSDVPSMQHLFRSSRMEQANKFMAMMDAIVARMDELDKLTFGIQQLAVRHIHYGVKREHYQPVGAALLWTLEQTLGPDWNEEVAEAWTSCYTILVELMVNPVYSIKE